MLRASPFALRIFLGPDAILESSVLDFSGWNRMPPRDWAPPESEDEIDAADWGMAFECAGLPRDPAEVVDDAAGLFE